MLDCVKGVRVWHVQRVQDQRIHHAKDHCICADSHGQGQHGNDQESGALCQHASRIPQVLPKCLHGFTPRLRLIRALILPIFPFLTACASDI